MHPRVKDKHDVVHYADKVWVTEVAQAMYAPWCKLGRERVRPPPKDCMRDAAVPRNQAVTCFFCLHLRHGVRSGY
jgi:hypothetical protein